MCQSVYCGRNDKEFNNALKTCQICGRVKAFVSHCTFLQRAMIHNSSSPTINLASLSGATGLLVFSTAPNLKDNTATQGPGRVWEAKVPRRFPCLRLESSQDCIWGHKLHYFEPVNFLLTPNALTPPPPRLSSPKLKEEGRPHQVVLQRNWQRPPISSPAPQAKQREKQVPTEHRTALQHRSAPLVLSLSAPGKSHHALPFL